MPSVWVTGKRGAKVVVRPARALRAANLDLILLSGVPCHLSDMLVGLCALRILLRPGGTLIVEASTVHDDQTSYAVFGRFFAGMSWQRTTVCVQDMCELMGFEAVMAISKVPWS